jgi:hypothetical protein
MRGPSLLRCRTTRSPQAAHCTGCWFDRFTWLATLAPVRRVWLSPRALGALAQARADRPDRANRDALAAGFQSRSAGGKSPQVDRRAA